MADFLRAYRYSPGGINSRKSPSSSEGDFASDSRRLDTDDRPLGFAAGYFLEAGLVVHGLRPESHVLVLGTSRFIDRISLNQGGTAFLSVSNCALEECPRHALAAILGWHNKADD